ncbi:MAG TPA: hypothetical protein VF818_00800 [Ktedonobacterales bacterium]
MYQYPPNQQPGGMYQSPPSQPPSAVVAPQADILMRRLQELERAVNVQEWWLLGRELAEAKVLAEVASLLAVARAELDQVLVEFCGQPSAIPPVGGEETTANDENPTPALLARYRAIAGQLLHMLSEALPPTTTFAQQLRPFAQNAGMPGPAVDTLGIVADRLVEAYETVQSLGR